jgi:hypothetical protein
MSSGNALAAAAASPLVTVPIEAVGQATRAIAARIRSSGAAGWR